MIERVILPRLDDIVEAIERIHRVCRSSISGPCSDMRKSITVNDRMQRDYR
jgi:hypothetical protein